MTTEERREREREQRRQQILQAAKNLILEQGYDQTSMQEIADRAELGKGTLYLYYNDKDTLLVSITKLILEELRVKFRKIMRNDQNGY